MKAIRSPVGSADLGEPSYPTLAEELRRPGVPRRTFLLAGLAGVAGAAGAATRCMGAPPPPLYPPPKFYEVVIGLEPPALLTGCGHVKERQSYGQVAVSSTDEELVRRLRPQASQAAFRLQIAQVASQAACQHTTLGAMQRRVEEVLHGVLLGWYRTATGVSVRPRDLRVELRAGPPPSTRESQEAD